MRDIKNSIVVIMLVFVSVLMLIASLEYSSNIINAGSEPVDYYSSGDGVPSDGSGKPSPSQLPGEVKEEKTGDGIDIGQLPGQGDESKFDPFAAGQDPGPVLAMIVIVAIVLAAISVFAYWIIRRRRGKSSKNTESDLAEPPGTLPDSPRSFEGRYKLRFPQICEPLPLTWGADEPLELAIVCRDEADGEARLSVGDGEARLIRLERGKARVTLRLTKGCHRVTVCPGDRDVPGEASWADVQIVDYREEIVRMFNELCRSLKSGDEGVRDEMTPRELERIVIERMPETWKAMSAVVTVFEFANYSTHAIRRTEYERMYLSGMGLR
jgi:hypothetical protein